MASEGFPRTGCLLIAQSLGFSPRSRAGTSGSKGVPANSRRLTSGFPAGAPFPKSAALPIELTTHTPGENRTRSSSVKGSRAHRYTTGAKPAQSRSGPALFGCERLLVPKGGHRRKIVGRPSPPRLDDVWRDCPVHGLTIFRQYGAGPGKERRWRCRRCVGEAVTRRHRKVRAMLVAEAGGRCAVCGYDHCEWNLHFHHVDPATKSLAMTMGSGKSLADYRAELAKCVLLCATCHGGVEYGLIPGPPAGAQFAG